MLTSTGNLGRQGWHSGESTRLSLMWPAFYFQNRCYMQVEFVVGSRSFASGFSGFPLSSKTIVSNSNWKSEGHRFVSRNRLLSVTLVKQS